MPKVANPKMNARASIGSTRKNFVDLHLRVSFLHERDKGVKLVLTVRTIQPTIMRRKKNKVFNLPSNLI